MIFFGTVLGSPLAGWISDKMGRRKLPMLIGAVLSLALMLFIIYGNITNYAVLVVMFFLLGLITSAQVISYPTIAESNPISLTATSVSVISFTTIGIGGAILIPFFGKLMDWKWNHLVVDNVAVYSASDYQRGLIIIPIAFVIAFIAACFLRETYCRKADGINS
jgi:MFS family permease